MSLIAVLINHNTGSVRRDCVQRIITLMVASTARGGS